jgi:hypothetical protein
MGENKMPILAVPERWSRKSATRIPQDMPTIVSAYGQPDYARDPDQLQAVIAFEAQTTVLQHVHRELTSRTAGDG